MADNDPKADELLRKFYQEELSPEAHAERDAMPDSGQVSDDQVQEVVDCVDGKDDGLAALPETDLGNVLAALKDGRLSGPSAPLCLFFAVMRDLFVKGDGHATTAEQLEAAEKLGTAVMALVKLALVLIPK